MKKPQIVSKAFILLAKKCANRPTPAAQPTSILALGATAANGGFQHMVAPVQTPLATGLPMPNTMAMGIPFTGITGGVPAMSTMPPGGAFPGTAGINAARMDWRRSMMAMASAHVNMQRRCVRPLPLLLLAPQARPERVRAALRQKNVQPHQYLRRRWASAGTLTMSRPMPVLPHVPKATPRITMATLLLQLRTAMTILLQPRSRLWTSPKMDKQLTQHPVKPALVMLVPMIRVQLVVAVALRRPASPSLGFPSHFSTTMLLMNK